MGYLVSLETRQSADQNMKKPLIKKVASGGESIYDVLLKPDVVISRYRLMRFMPHRGAALVASYLLIENGVSSLVLSKERFHYYTKGHTWAYPGHWQGEMVAQAIGLEAMRKLHEDKFDFQRLDHPPMLINPGFWLGKFLDISLDCDMPLVVKPIRSDIKCVIKMGHLKITGSARIRQGTKEEKVIDVKTIAKICETS